MPSGKQSKRRRAAQAPPPVRAAGRGRKASPRVLIAAAALVAVVIAVVAAVAIGGRSSPSAPAALAGAAQVEKLLKGIPQHGNVLGSPTAPVTLAEYIDLQCPFCKEFETQGLPTLIAKYVRTGQVKIEARPIAFIGPDSQRGRAAALAAGRQNRMFDLMELLYLNQGTENTGWLTNGVVRSAAASIPGVDAAKLIAASGSSAVASRSKALDAQAAADRVTQTPTLLVGKSGKQLTEVALRSPVDVTSVATAIGRALG